MAENNDEEVYISFTIDKKRGSSYTITKLPQPIPGLKCIQRYKVKQYLGPERIIYTDDLLFWEKLKKNHYNNNRQDTFEYFKPYKDIKKQPDEEFLYALLGEDFLGPEKLKDIGTGNSIYIGALIEGEDGHYTVNKKPLVEAVIPYLNKYNMKVEDKHVTLKNLIKYGSKDKLINFLVRIIDCVAYLERHEEMQIVSENNSKDIDRC